MEEKKRSSYSRKQCMRTRADAAALLPIVIGVDDSSQLQIVEFGCGADAFNFLRCSFNDFQYARKRPQLNFGSCVSCVCARRSSNKTLIHLAPCSAAQKPRSAHVFGLGSAMICAAESLANRRRAFCARIPSRQPPPDVYAAKTIKRIHNFACALARLFGFDSDRKEQ